MVGGTLRVKGDLYAVFRRMPEGKFDYAAKDYPNGLRAVAVFRSEPLAKEYVTSRGAGYEFASFASRAELLGFLRARESQKITHVAFDLKSGSRSDILVPIRELIDSVRNIKVAPSPNDVSALSVSPAS